MKTSLWVERYRPKTISEVIFQDDKQEQFFKNIVLSGDLPNLLLYGVQGTGKTTISKALINDLQIDPSDVLRLKCSDEKIDALRDKAIGFAMTFPLGKFKVIQLEEFDYLSLDAQALLRSLIEDSSENCRYIATCNYVNKVIPPLRSRFQEVSFKSPDQEKVAMRMADMLEKEGVIYDAEELLNYVAVGYPDIRKTIQLLSQNVSSKKLLAAKDVSEGAADWKFGLLECIQKGDFKKARKLVCESATREEHEDVYKFLYQNIDKLKVGDKDQAIVLIAEYLSRNPLMADTEIGLSALFIELGKL